MERVKVAYPVETSPTAWPSVTAVAATTDIVVTVVSGSWSLSRSGFESSSCCAHISNKLCGRFSAQIRGQLSSFVLATSACAGPCPFKQSHQRLLWYSLIMKAYHCEIGTKDWGCVDCDLLQRSGYSRCAINLSCTTAHCPKGRRLQNATCKMTWYCHIVRKRKSFRLCHQI